jgi:hypothetical protein
MRRIFLALAVLFVAIIIISATGQAQTIQVSPGTMTFSTVQPVGSPFPGVLPVLVTNTSSQSVTFTSATVTGDFFFGPDPFTQSVSFGTLIPGGTISFNLYFNATAPGSRTGTLTLVDSAAGSPQSFTVSGTGFTGAMVQPDGQGPLSIYIPTLGTSITNQLHMVSVGTDPVTVTGVSVTGAGFSQTNTCGAVMAQGQNCQVNLIFDPTVAGQASGNLTVMNTGVTNPLVIPITGDAADFSFTIDPNSASASINAGQQAMFPFIVFGLPPGTNLDAIAFSCSGLPAGAACAVKAGSLLIPGPLSAELVISTTGSSASLHNKLPSRAWPWAAAFAMLALVIPRRGKRGSLLALLLMIGIAGSVTAFVGCGSSRSAMSTPPGTFTITVSGMRNGLTHSFPVRLTVK